MRPSYASPRKRSNRSSEIAAGSDQFCLAWNIYVYRTRLLISSSNAKWQDNAELLLIPSSSKRPRGEILAAPGAAPLFVGHELQKVAENGGV